MSGGECGIRTHVGVSPNGFQDRPVMTASVTLQIALYNANWVTVMTQFVAQKEGFEPSRAFYTPTPLAGEPLRPLGYFCMPLEYDITAIPRCQ